MQESHESEFEERRVHALRRMGSVGRLKAAFGLFDFASAHLAANFRAKHPEWTEDQLRRAVRERRMASR